MNHNRISGIIRMFKGNKCLLASRLFFSLAGHFSGNTPCGNCRTDAGRFVVRIIINNKCAACGFGRWRK